MNDTNFTRASIPEIKAWQEANRAARQRQVWGEAGLWLQQQEALKTLARLRPAQSRNGVDKPASSKPVG